MIFKGLKKKLRRYKSIFTDHWDAFVTNHPRYDTDYYQAEVAKMLNCGSEANGFAVYQCLFCGKGSTRSILVVKVKPVFSVVSVMPETA